MLNPIHSNELTRSAINPKLAYENFESVDRGVLPYGTLVQIKGCTTSYILRNSKAVYKWDQTAKRKVFHSNRFCLSELDSQRVCREVGKSDLIAPANTGWECRGLDPLSNWEQMEWGCFKPDHPRWDSVKQKPRKYEHPAKQATRIFCLRMPRKLWQAIGDRYGVQVPSTVQSYGDFWQWVKANPIPIFWTEGVKKAAALLSHGYLAIALPGITGGYRNKKNDDGERIAGSSYLIPEVAFFADGRNHLICFDQDTKASTIKNVNSSIRNFGGLLKKSGGEVSVLTWDSVLGKGCDDLIFEHGIRAFETVTAAAKSLDLWKISLSQQVTRSPDFLLNSPRLGSLVIPNTERLIAIQSAMGTGKTHSIAELISDQIGDPDQVFFVLTHRESLGADLSRRFGIAHRKDISVSGEGAMLGYVLCADSLHGKANPSFSAADYESKKITVIIDEAESVTQHILGSQTDIKTHRLQVLDNLGELLSMALTNGQVFLADAHLSDRSINFFQGLACKVKPELFGIKPFYVKNDFKPGDVAPWHCHMFSSKVPSVWFESLCQTLDTDHTYRALISVESQKISSKWSTQTYETDLKKRYPDRRIVRVDGETVCNPNHPAYRSTENLTEFYERWDIVICSNVIESGVSIDCKETFNGVWANIWGVSSARQACQMLARLRDPVDRHIWISPRAVNRIGNGSINTKDFFNSTDSLSKTTIRALKHHGLMDIDENGADLLALNTYAEYAAEINSQGRNLYQSVVEYLVADAHQIVSLNQDNNKFVTQSLAVIAETNHQAEAEAIADSPLLKKEQAQLLERKKDNRTDENRRSLRKYHLEQRYGESSAETVRKDDKSWHPQLQLHYFLSVGRRFLEERDASKVSETVYQRRVFAPDVNRSTYVAKVGLLERLGFLEFISTFSGEVVEVYQGCDRLAKFVKECHYWRSCIRDVFGIFLKDEWFENGHVTILKKILKLFGGTLFNSRKVGERGNQKKVYQVVQEINKDNHGKIVSFTPWGTDGRDLVFARWLERDFARARNVSVDTVVQNLYKYMDGEMDYTKEPPPWDILTDLPDVLGVLRKVLDCGRDSILEVFGWCDRSLIEPICKALSPQEIIRLCW